MVTVRKHGFWELIDEKITKGFYLWNCYASGCLDRGARGTMKGSDLHGRYIVGAGRLLGFIMYRAMDDLFCLSEGQDEIEKGGFAYGVTLLRKIE